MKKFFETNENFEGIIRTNLNTKEIVDINFISTGWTNIVYEVNTNQGTFFFRFPRDEFWSRTIVKDYQFGKYIWGKTEFDTIKLDIKYDAGRPFSIHKKIEGVPLAEKMDCMSNNEIETVSNDIARFMIQLHTLEFDSKKIFTINNIGLNLSDFLDELICLHLNKEDRDFWNMDALDEDELCLVHGDLNSSNIILDDNNHIAGVIDFGFGGFGKKYNDIARIIGRCPENFKQKIVENYEKYSNKKIDENILEKEIERWSLIDKGYINYMKNIGIYK